MKAVIQRVSQTKVEVDQKVISQIGRGFLVLLGVEKDDDKKAAEILAKKVANLRIMADSQNKMNLSIKDVDGEILVVSQFTLIAQTKKGNRPSFIKAAEPKRAEKLYQYFIKKLKDERVKNVKMGKFAAYMEVSLVNDGPVTIILEA